MRGVATSASFELCGKDKYGLSWQIIPTALGELMGDKDPQKATRVMDAMLKTGKIEIRGLERPYPAAVMSLRAQLRQGIFGQGARGAAVTVVLGVIAIATSLVYDALNHGPNVVFLRTPIDDLIPVVGPFVIPYVSLRPFLYGSALVFLFFRARIYRSAAISMTVVLLISYVFYVFMQSYIDRPVLLGDDLFSRMIRDVYAGDQPYNDFPSLHASLSTVFAIHWWRVDRRIGLAVAIWVALIVVSTVFVKQHYVADMIAGTALAFLVSRVSLARLVDRGTAAR
ncbi:MAG TPA: phosphatase PAP2 family protein [Candidatus Limnocylindria bacterium]